MIRYSQGERAVVEREHGRKETAVEERALSRRER
jgi:hypothetical protein